MTPERPGDHGRALALPVSTMTFSSVAQGTVSEVDGRRASGRRFLAASCSLPAPPSAKGGISKTISQSRTLNDGFREGDATVVKAVGTDAVQQPASWSGTMSFVR